MKFIQEFVRLLKKKIYRTKRWLFFDLKFGSKLYHFNFQQSLSIECPFEKIEKFITIASNIKNIKTCPVSRPNKNTRDQGHIILRARSRPRLQKKSVSKPSSLLGTIEFCSQKMVQRNRFKICIRKS